MKVIKWAVLLIPIMLVSWYAIDFIRFSDYDEKKRIAEMDGNTLMLAVIQVEPDASYKLSEVKISDDTRITGMGFQSLFVNHIDDLKLGQKVRVWYKPNEDNEHIAEKVVVYSF
ncbi:hypothetical protein [Mesobacillus subterraneus]|uniref:hypothetical protein n=1 Tax=Mesobacillus subterraneus TaxID=285983 RepID=UPI000F737984|nr:hypothetical protein [Mesobacillus subterraneus]